MINVWTDAIWKSQKLRKGEHIMKKEHSKYQWIIGICCSENDGVKLYKYTGTVKKMKKRLLRLIKEDKKNEAAFFISLSKKSFYYWINLLTNRRYEKIVIIQVY